jgi:hypothetical protein
MGQLPEKDTTEEMMSKYFNEPCYITFYNAKGWALRETMFSERNHMDNILHRQATKKAKELGADHWAIFKHWTTFNVYYTEQELEELDD